MVMHAGPCGTLAKVDDAKGGSRCHPCGLAWSLKNLLPHLVEYYRCREVRERIYMPSHRKKAA